MPKGKRPRPDDDDTSIVELFPDLASVYADPPQEVGEEEALASTKGSTSSRKGSSSLQPAGRYSKVRKAINARDICEVAWELLDVTLSDIETTGVSPLGKSILMELVRTISVQKGNDLVDGRIQKVDELKTWLRKAT
jgi:hypothetical protein